MPELPEVETVRRGLERHLVGRAVVAVEVCHPRAVRRHPAGPDDFRGRLVGATVESARRRGKYLWLPLDTGDAVVAHLGMSGQFRVAAPQDPVGAHVRARVVLSDDTEVRFLDQRTFGGLSLEPLTAEPGTVDLLPASLQHIARDPFDPAFDSAAVVRAVRGRHTEIKRALLDQTVLSGVGNIYADEALWRSRLHFARSTQRLTRAQVGSVIEAACEVMARALDAGGTSFDALYVNVNGDSGYFERSLEVYGREDEPCSRCGAAIRRVAFTNRSSFFCPRCQRPPRRPRPPVR